MPFIPLIIRIMTGHLSHSSPSTGNPLIWPAADRRDGDEQTTDAADHSRMHFNFPPCCVQSMASTRIPYSRKPEKNPVRIRMDLPRRCWCHTTISTVRPSSSRSDCCKSAKPQMLNATHKSIPSPPTQRPKKRTHGDNRNQATKLFNLLAIYYGSSLWDYRTARTQTPVRARIQTHGQAAVKTSQNHPHPMWMRKPRREGRTTDAFAPGRWGIANKKGGKSTLLWHLILIFFDSWDGGLLMAKDGGNYSRTGR